MKLALEHFTNRELRNAIQIIGPTLFRYGEGKAAPMQGLRPYMIRVTMALFYKKYNKEI